MERTVDFYEILQVEMNADKADIASSYRRLCKLYHPDLNHMPEAEELMKQINIAYHVLCDDLRREAYNNGMNAGRSSAARRNAARENAARETAAREHAAPREEKREDVLSVAARYFDALLRADFEKAYECLSLYDRQYVTLQSFRKWRKSVQGLYSMRAYSIEPEEVETRITLEDGRTLPAKKLHISISEKNTVTQAVDRYQAAKLCIQENGTWRIFLGYRDLNEIARVFENLSAEQEQGEKTRIWESYCAERCRELDMLSLTGLMKEARREICRYQRYRQPLVLACFSLRAAAEAVSEGKTPDLLEVAAKTIMKSVREFDIPAYVGDGVFAILLVELKKRHISAVTERVSDMIKKTVLAETGVAVTVDSAALPYTGEALNTFVERVSKKIKK